MYLPIVEVVVYRDGATVTRAGELIAADGVLEIAGLPLLLDARNLTVAVTGADVLSTELALDTAGLHRGRRPEASEDLAAARLAVAQVAAQLETLADQEHLLRALTPAGARDDVPPPSAETLHAWADATQAQGRWLRDLQRERRTLQRQHEALVEERDQLYLEVLQSSGEAAWRHWHPTRVLRVSVSPSAGPLAVRVTYRVSGATWTPAYALEANADFTTGRLVFRALVGQVTGEDWRDARLTLSTAALARQVNVPTRRALRLGRSQAPTRDPWRPLPTDLETLFPARLAADTAPAQEQPSQPVEWSEDSVAALDTGVPQPIRRDRLADPSPIGEPYAKPHPTPTADDELDAQHLPVPLSPSAMMSGAAVSESASARSPRRRAKKHAAPGRPRPTPAGPIEPEDLDYARLRMAHWDDAPGRRGRLQPWRLSDEATAGGVPAEAIPFLDRARWSLERQAQELGHNLPAHHVLPSPIQGDHHRYSASASATILSDGKLHSVSVTTAPLSLTVAYEAAPRHDPRVFRTVTATMAGQLPLLPGPMNVVVDGASILTTAWTGASEDSLLHLGFGVEDRLRVARNVRYSEESKGLFGGERQVHTHVTVTVASALPADVQITLLDTLPVAADDSVRVALADATPTAAPYRGADDGPLLDGGLRQVLPLPAGGEATATLHWHMTLNAKLDIEGGERRG